MRFVTLLEIGTHAIFAAAHGTYKEGENTLAKRILPCLKADMLLIADRGFGCYPIFSEASKNGADLLFRVREAMKFACMTILEDGSYLSKIYPSFEDRLKDRNGITVRVIEYRLKGGKEKYVLIPSILDPLQAPANELAAVYHERWENEMSYDEIKNHLKEPGECLRSKTPELVIQEFYGYLLTHFTIRSLMHQAALKNACDPDALSFTDAVRIVRRKITAAHSPLCSMEIEKICREIIDEIAQRKVVSSRGLRERAVKRKMKSWHIKKYFSTRQAPTKPVVRIK